MNRLFYIKIVSSFLTGKKITIPAVNSFTIGRGTLADITINDPWLSRLHCRISTDGETWCITDLDSTNGTWVGGKIIFSRVLLPLSTSVRIGRIVFQLRCDDKDEDNTILSSALVNSLPLLESKPLHSSVLTKKAGLNLEAISKIQKSLSDNLSHKSLFEKILQSVDSVLAFSKAALLTYDLQRGGFYHILEYHNKDNSFSKGYLDSHKLDLVDYAKATNEVCTLKICSTNGKEISALCVPLLGRDQIKAFLWLESGVGSEQYSSEILDVMAVISRTAGMAIEYADIFDLHLKNMRLAAIGTAASSLSHYIKNILTGLNGSMELLDLGVAEQDSKTIQTSMKIIKNNHSRLSGLVLNLLNLAGKSQLQKRKINLRNWIIESCESMNPKIKQTGLISELICNLPVKEVYAEVDSDGLYRVLLNLVNNAQYAVKCKQTIAGAEYNGEIIVALTNDYNAKQATLTVSDNGIGLTVEQKNKLFEPFVSSKGAGGTGLGLAVCQKIIESHEGSIDISDNLKGGCIVSCTIPSI